MKWLAVCAIGASLAFANSAAIAQEDGEEPPTFPFGGTPLGDGPWDFEVEAGTIHVEVVTKDLVTPWSLAFLPDGGMLVTERGGQLRIVRDGVLDPTPIAGLPPMYTPGIAGLMDVALHPDFESNRLVYLSYSKPSPDAAPEDINNSRSSLAIMRARWDGGHELTDVEDIFIADAWYGDPPLPPKCCGQGPAFGSFGGRILFDDEGHLFVTSGDRNYGEMVQDNANHFGKILRLNDDGSPADGNPGTYREGWAPEIWTTGHRNPLGLYLDRETGHLWSTEFGPRGGDELNLVEGGANYGWISVTQGYHYGGDIAKGVRNVEGMIDPVFAFGPPSINPGNLTVYHGDEFADWEGDLLMVTMSRTLERMEVTRGTAITARETMLTELGQRFRDVKVGPDGAVYILTDERSGALLRVTQGE